MSFHVHFVTVCRLKEDDKEMPQRNLWNGTELQLRSLRYYQHCRILYAYVGFSFDCGVLACDVSLA
jgi:hypothetical protein